MKNLYLYLYATFFLGLLFIGCNSEKLVTTQDDEFNNILSEIYNCEKEYFNITRSGEFIINVDECSAIENKINHALEKYGVLGEAENSNYYNKTLTKADPKYDFDIYDYLNYIDTEATPAMKEFVNKIVIEDEIIELNSILNNEELLPDEKIALVACCNFINFCNLNNPVDMTRTTAKQCAEAYSIDMKTCRNNAALGYLLAACTAAAPLLGLGAALGTSAYYEICLNSAYDKLVLCLKYATDE